jgi:hypothetical protein
MERGMEGGMEGGNGGKSSEGAMWLRAVGWSGVGRVH